MTCLYLVRTASGRYFMCWYGDGMAALTDLRADAQLCLPGQADAVQNYLARIYGITAEIIPVTNPDVAGNWAGG